MRARITDQGDGTYAVRWSPNVSGKFKVAVSLFGNPIRGSPFHVDVVDPAPHAPMCQVRGDALHSVTARMPSTFEIRFRDRADRVAPAIDLDVFVVPVPEVLSAPSVVIHNAWDVATQPISKLVAQPASKDDSSSYRKKKRLSVTAPKDGNPTPATDQAPSFPDAGTAAASPGAGRRSRSSIFNTGSEHSAAISTAASPARGVEVEHDKAVPPATKQLRNSESVDDDDAEMQVAGNDMPTIRKRAFPIQVLSRAPAGH